MPDRSGRLNLSVFFWPLVSVAMGLVASGFMMTLLGANPLLVYSRLVSLAFRDVYNVADIFAKATPLILTGLAFGFAFRAKLFNIGAQGQFYLGCAASAWCALRLGHLSPWLLLPSCLVASVVAGALWAALVGYAKARFNANEFLVSMMSTYVALAVMNYLLRGPLKETKGEYPQTDVLAEGSWIPKLVPHTRLHWGLIVALAVAVLAWFILWRTSLGYRIRAVGMNPDAAKYAGIDSGRIFVTVFALSGAFAGLAGFTQVNGIQHMLVQGFSPTLGAEGIGIAILGNAHPLGIVLAALLFGALQVGGNLAVQTSGVPASIVAIMEGFVMLFVILSCALQAHLALQKSRRQSSEKEGER
ncbi:MAG: ABC transporter permease [Dethiosulfovibrio peptidovorans]|nr:MAG: ABC transporter permease [Dethiosulfovibrio peptidovorans]